jgi:hypothetical protein
MNELFKEIAIKAQIEHCVSHVRLQEFAELIVQDCANFVRENYDHEAAESIAWTMEVKYGLHGDYA